jgi:predicted RNA-binding Zn-ribbon protein involved in translation (DUF1610 family)
VDDAVTIRHALRLWYRFLWMGVLAVGVLAASWQATWDNHWFRVALLGFCLVSVIGVFAFGFRCPRCGTSLIHKAAVILTKDCAVACPTCGVSLDEPREDPANAK